MNLLTKLKLQYALASKTRLYKAVIGGGSGGATAMWLAHAKSPLVPYLTTASPKDLLTAAGAGAFFAALNFIRDPERTSTEKFNLLTSSGETPSS